MKILITHNVVEDVEDNPFVRVLRDGLLEFGHQVVCSRDEFWNAPSHYDLIYIQWPDDLPLDGHRKTHDLCALRKQLSWIRNMGIQMVVTVHNLHPHSNDPYISQVYDCVYEVVDAFHHMGSYSCEILKMKFPNAYHFVVPHPAYYNEKEMVLTQEDCRKKYGLPKQYPIVLAFGAVRNDVEREMLIKLSHHFYFKCCIWVPKMHRSLRTNRNKLSKILTYIVFRIHGIRMHRGLICEKDVIEIVQASDIIFIQRKEILNSGNLPLGFSMGKIVVGPDKGNVGRILRETGNPVFNPDDHNSINGALVDALKMFNSNNLQGLKNFEYARKYWSKRRVAELLNNEILNINASNKVRRI